MPLIRARVVSGKVSVKNADGTSRTVRPTDPDPFVYVTPSFLKAGFNLMVAAPLPVEEKKSDPKPDPKPEMRNAVPPASEIKDEQSGAEEKGTDETGEQAQTGSEDQAQSAETSEALTVQETGKSGKAKK